MLCRSQVKLTDDSQGIQTLQAELYNKRLVNIPRLQNYGLTSRPHQGAEGLSVFLNGNLDSGIMLVVDDKRYRLKNLQSGEVALYTDEGDTIHLKRNNTIEITTKTLHISASQGVTIDTPLLAVSGDIQDKNGTLDSLRQTYKTHTHTGDSGGSTSPPK